nr:hypothetical protein [Cohaesibacter gelatinilyticus]
MTTERTDGQNTEIAKKIAKRFHRVIIGLANECRTNHMKAMLAKGFQR